MLMETSKVLQERIRLRTQHFLNLFDKKSPFFFLKSTGSSIELTLWGNAMATSR